MQDNPQNNTGNFDRSELWSLSLRDLFYKYIRFLPWIVLSIAVALFGAYAYLRYTIPIYSTTGTLVIKTEQQGGRNDKLDDIFTGNKAQNIQSEMEVLRSKGLMSRVVLKKNLQYSYFAKGRIKTINIYKASPIFLETLQLKDSSAGFIMKLKFTNDKTFTVDKDKTPVGLNQKFTTWYGTFRLIRNNFGSISKDYSIIYQPLVNAAAAYAGGIQVMPKLTGTGILNISMQSSNPMLAADVINQLMEEYGDYTRELKKRTADSSLAFIEKRMELFGRELDSVQNRLLQYSQENNLIDISSQSAEFFANISSADKSVNDKQMQINTADFIDDYLRNKKNAFSSMKVPSSLGLGDGTLNTLIGNFNVMQLERQGMLDANVPPENPAVIEINDRIEKLRASILESLANIKRSYVKTIGTIRENSSKSETQLMGMPFKEKGYMDIKRQVDNKQALYNIMLQKREETALSRAATIENSQIVEKAYVPGSPIKPKKRSYK